MRTSGIITLAALAFGVVAAAPAFGQEACIRFQQNCSDAAYPAAQPTAKRLVKALYNVAPSGSCIRFQQGCSDAPYPATRR